MLIIGYPGIGKSSCCNLDSRFIDLESSNFIHDLENLNWPKSYVNVALDLHRQGFIVFISSHYIVRDLLIEEFKKDKTLDSSSLLIIYPTMELKEIWQERIQKRLDKTHLEKDKRAYNRVLNFFDQDIASLANTPIGTPFPIDAYALRVGSGYKADHAIDYTAKIPEYLESFNLAFYIKWIIDHYSLKINDVNICLSDNANFYNLNAKQLTGSLLVKEIPNGN